MKTGTPVRGTLFFSAGEIRSARRRLTQPGALGDQARALIRQADEQLRSAAPASWIEADRPLSPAWVSAACPACSRVDRWCGWTTASPLALHCNHCGEVFPSARFPEAHKDVVGGREYPYYLSPAGLRYYFSGVARGHRLMRAVEIFHSHLPIAWLLTGEARYAEPVAAALRQMGRVYGGWPMLHDAVNAPSGAGVRAEVRQYDFPEATFAYRTRLWQWAEAVLLKHALMAYDAVKDASLFTRDDVELIRDGYVREALEGFVVNKLLFMHNRFHNSFGDYLSSMVLAGRLFGTHLRVRDLCGGRFVLSGPDLIHEALDGAAGIRQFLENAYGSDGMYFENTYSYHVHALKVVLPGMLALRGYSDPVGYRPSPWLQPTPSPGALNLRASLGRYITALRGFDRFVRADLRGIPENDSFGDSLADMSANLHIAAWRLCESRWAGDRAAGLLARGGGRERAEKMGADRIFFDNYFLFGGRLPKRGILPRLRPTVVGSGFAALRCGGTSLHMSWDEPRQFHSHADQLAIQFFSQDREMLLDLGYMGAGHVMRHVWMNRTASHNTVVVDKRNQRAWPDAPAGRLLRFNVTRSCSVVEAEAPQCYAGVHEYRRLSALVRVGAKKCYVADFFHVRGGRQHDYALMGNGNECRVKGVALKSVPGTLAGPRTEYACAEQLSRAQVKGENGYRFIDDMAQGVVRQDRLVAEALWKIHQGGELKAFIAAERGDRLVSGRYPVLRGHAWHADPERLRKARTMIVRRRPRDGRSAFIAVLSPGNDGVVRSVEYLFSGPSGQVLRVNHAGGYDIVLCGAPGKGGVEWEDYATDASLALARYDARGRLREVVAFGGSRLELPGASVPVPPGMARRVVETFELENRLRLDRPLADAAALVGEIVTVQSGPAQHVFCVKRAQGAMLWVDADHARLIGGGGVVTEVLSPDTFFTATPMMEAVQPGCSIWIGGRRFRVRRFERTGTGPDLQGIYHYKGRRGCRITVHGGGLLGALCGAEFRSGVVSTGSTLRVSRCRRVTFDRDGVGRLAGD